MSAVSGSTSAAGSVSTTKLAKYRPAASLTTVTVDGADGSIRDHLTGTGPIFGRFSFPPVVIDQRAFAVNRTACRLSLRLLNRGGPIFGPRRVPLSDARKFPYAVSRSRRDCCRTTAETSPSQARSGVFFDSVNRFDSSAAFGNGRPAARASSRNRRPSLNTTRAHPNARANANR